MSLRDRIMDWVLCSMSAVLSLAFLACSVDALFLEGEHRFAAIPLFLFSILTGMAAVTRPWKTKILAAVSCLTGWMTGVAFLATRKGRWASLFAIAWLTLGIALLIFVMSKVLT